MSKHVILFLAANPSGTTEVKLGEECREIEQELRLSAHRDDFDLRSHWAVSVDDVLRYLNELQPSVIHFSGHGEHDTGLVLQNEQGEPQLVSPEALEKVIAAAATNVRLIVLNACYASEQARVLQQTAECVVGMAGSIRDTDARAYAAGFYRALGYRKSIGIAHEQGIATVLGRGGPSGSPRDVRKQPVDRSLDTFKPVLLPRSGINPSKLWLTPPAPSTARSPALFTSALIAVVLVVLGVAMLLIKHIAITPVDAKPPVQDARAPIPLDAPPDAPRDAPRPAPPDAAVDAPRDAAVDAPPDAPPKPPAIEILRPRPGSSVFSDFEIEVKVEGDDISVVELEIGKLPKQTRPATSTGSYLFRAPPALSDDRPRIRVTARTKHGLFTDTSITVSVLHPSICWVTDDDVHSPRRTRDVSLPDGCDPVDSDGLSSRPGSPRVPIGEPRFKSAQCVKVYECRRLQ